MKHETFYQVLREELEARGVLLSPTPNLQDLPLLLRSFDGKSKEVAPRLVSEPPKAIKAPLEILTSAAKTAVSSTRPGAAIFVPSLTDTIKVGAEIVSNEATRILPALWRKDPEWVGFDVTDVSKVRLPEDSNFTVAHPRRPQKESSSLVRTLHSHLHVLVVRPSLLDLRPWLPHFKVQLLSALEDAGGRNWHYAIHILGVVVGYIRALSVTSPLDPSKDGEEKLSSHTYSFVIRGHGNQTTCVVSRAYDPKGRSPYASCNLNELGLFASPNSALLEALVHFLREFTVRNEDLYNFLQEEVVVGSEVQPDPDDEEDEDEEDEDDKSFDF